MIWNKRNLVIVGLGGGIMLFFIGMATNIALGPSTASYFLPQQLSSIIKLTGMGIVCICMIVGGFFVDKLERDTKILLVLFGVLLLLLNIFIFSYSSSY